MVQNTQRHLLPAQGSCAEELTGHQGTVEKKSLSLAVEGAPGQKIARIKKEETFSRKKQVYLQQIKKKPNPPLPQLHQS